MGLGVQQSLRLQHNMHSLYVRACFAAAAAAATAAWRPHSSASNITCNMTRGGLLILQTRAAWCDKRVRSNLHAHSNGMQHLTVTETLQ